MTRISRIYRPALVDRRERWPKRIAETLVGFGNLVLTARNEHGVDVIHPDVIEDMPSVDVRFLRTLLQAVRAHRAPMVFSAGRFAIDSDGSVILQLGNPGDGFGIIHEDVADIVAPYTSDGAQVTWPKITVGRFEPPLFGDELEAANSAAACIKLPKIIRTDKLTALVTEDIEEIAGVSDAPLGR